jgi:hypothetical protein
MLPLTANGKNVEHDLAFIGTGFRLRPGDGARQGPNHRPRSRSSMSEEANPSAGAPIEA